MEKDPAAPPRLPRRTKREINALLSEFHKSKQSPAKFCKAHEIHKATFFKWISREKLSARKDLVVSGFAPVEVVNTVGTPLLFAEVNGVRIYQRVPAAFLKLLMK